jgi:hypothetical protein
LLISAHSSLFHFSLIKGCGAGVRKGRTRPI